MFIEWWKRATVTSNRYWLHESVTWEIDTPWKLMLTEANPRLKLLFQGWQFPLVQSIIILYWMWIKYIVYITFGFKTIQVKWIFEFVFRTPYIHPLIRRQSESMVNRTRINSAQSILFGISSVACNITRCQLTSRVTAWFHESAVDIDFYQMSLSQSESTTLHESII